MDNIMRFKDLFPNVDLSAFDWIEDIICYDVRNSDDKALCYPFKGRYIQLTFKREHLPSGEELMQVKSSLETQMACKIDCTGTPEKCGGPHAMYRLPPSMHNKVHTERKHQKLELTWIGKDKRPRLEPRVLVEDAAKSHHAATRRRDGKDIFDNMLIHGDNLLALKALEQEFAGQVKCIYIDPPYNTGEAFKYYDDGLEHSIWLGLMRERLELLNGLLSKDGSLWIQIDDEEQAYLKILCDEIFGRENFVNMLAVNMKNIAGASGGGEDKRLKKTCEYILIYAKDYAVISQFRPQYVYTEMSNLIQQYLSEGVSWKYTSVLLDAGEKVYYGSTIDGEGNEIKVFIRRNPKILSIKQVADKDGISEKDAYKKYGVLIFQTTNAQSSIRTRVMDYRAEEKIDDDLISIEYVPKTGRNKGRVYEQFYKGDKCRLFVWLKDTSEIIDGELYKKDAMGTYWDMTPWMKNLTKEGSVEFPNGKKPEQLIRHILEMTTNPGDLVLDSFLGSGTTAAVAHKMGRRWIGVELGDHCYTHCKVRLDKVIDGEDAGGITKAVGWEGGGGYRFYELAPTFITKDQWGQEVINRDYNPAMLAEAVCKLEGYVYAPSQDEYFIHGHATEKAFIYVTTNFMRKKNLAAISDRLGEGRHLLICCKAFDKAAAGEFDNLTVRKIPDAVLNKCEWGHDDYSLNVANLPRAKEDEKIEQMELL